jgi:hypothetical protein
MIMQTELHEMTAAIADLDTYTQRSVIGSWSFFVNTQCLNQGMRAIPDVPEEGEGIDGFTPWEGAIKTALVDLAASEADGVIGDFTTTLPAWIALHRVLSSMMQETGGDPSTIESTHEFLCSKGPTRGRFEADFALRVQMGMRPGITRKDFVDGEYTKAMDTHAQMLAKGQHAISLIDRMILGTGDNIERGFDDLPDWATETLLQKLIQKLNDRWVKLEIQRTNPRVNKNNRDTAEGDQLLIVECLRHYGEIIAGVDVEAEDEAIALAELAAAKADD